MERGHFIWRDAVQKGLLCLRSLVNVMTEEDIQIDKQTVR